MASFVIRTGNQLPALVGSQSGPHVSRAGDRWWMVINAGGTSPGGGRLLYSDDDMRTWTDLMQVDSNTSSRAHAICAYQDSSAAWHLAVITTGGNQAATALTIRQIHSNVATGVPSSTVPTSVQIGAVAANQGMSWPTIIHTPTSTNRRLWVGVRKGTGSSLFERQLYFCAEGTAADTSGNWSNTNFTNIGTSNDNLGRHVGDMLFNYVSGSPRLHTVFLDPNTPLYRRFSFDPSAATPTPGTVTTLRTGAGQYDAATYGSQISMAGQDDEVLVAFHNQIAGTVEVMRSADGITWETPTGWDGITGAWPHLRKIGNNYALAYSTSATLTTMTAQQIRIISGDTMGSAEALSDTNGLAPHLVPIDENEEVGINYLSGTSPYSLRQDFKSVDFGLGAAPAYAGWGVVPI